MKQRPYVAEVIACADLRGRHFASPDAALHFARRKARKHRLAVAVWEERRDQQGRLVSHRLVKVVKPRQRPPRSPDQPRPAA